MPDQFQSIVARPIIRFAKLASGHAWCALALMFWMAMAAQAESGAKPEAGRDASGTSADPVRSGSDQSPRAAEPAESAAMALFLDRLMMAESGGRNDVSNPRSTAVGPFQFLESTFLEVTRRHFDDETGKLPPAQVLKLRTNRAFARRAAEAFTRDNAAHLATEGVEANFPNLRLAFLVGPSGAVRVLKAHPSTPAVRVLGTQVVQANPFMAGMTTSELVDWSKRNLSAAALASAGVKADPSRLGRRGAARPAINVRCSRGLASCRRWIALAKGRLKGKARAADNRNHGARSSRQRAR
ncbi:MAG: hypothetical protein R3D44_06235 [Hyphomicrobiaceae bacterium]